MKRLFALLLALSLGLSVSGCGRSGGEPPAGPPPSPAPAEDPAPAPPEPSEPSEPSPAREPTGIRLGLLPDCAALGAAGLAAGGLYELWRDGGAVEALASGRIDAAIIPVSDAVSLYNSTGGHVRIAAVTAAGGWALTERGEDIRDIFDLEGKTVYLPEGLDAGTRMFEHIAGECGFIVGGTLDVRYVDEDGLLKAELALMPSLRAGIAAADGERRTALDLGSLWRDMTDELLPAGCLAVSDSLSDDGLAALLYDLHDSQTRTDIPDLAADAGLAGTPEEAREALLSCELVWVEGAEALREALSGYIETLYILDPSLLGGQMPDGGLYRDPPRTPADR